MSTLVFDTLHFANQLKTVGVPEPQAEMQAELMADFAKEQKDQLDARETLLATKVDLKILEQRLENRIDKLEMKLNTKIDNMEYKFVIKLCTMLVISISALALLLKF
jgi:hypothetical protein